MPRYLAQVAYTPEAWRTQIGHPVDPHDRVGPAVAALGGSIECIYYAFGEYDVVAIFDLPDNAFGCGLRPRRRVERGDQQVRDDTAPHHRRGSRRDGQGRGNRVPPAQLKRAAG